MLNYLPQFKFHYKVTPEVAEIVVAKLMEKPDGASFAVVRETHARIIWMSRNSHDWLEKNMKVEEVA